MFFLTKRFLIVIKHLTPKHLNQCLFICLKITIDKKKKKKVITLSCSMLKI